MHHLWMLVGGGGVQKYALLQLASACATTINSKAACAALYATSAQGMALPLAYRLEMGP